MAATLEANDTTAYLTYISTLVQPQKQSPSIMKKRKRTLHIGIGDFMLANRKAARQEEILEHGHPVTFRSHRHKSKKVYDRKRDKRAGYHIADDLPFFFFSFAGKG